MSAPDEGLPAPPPPPMEDAPLPPSEGTQTYDGPTVERVGVNPFRSIPLEADGQPPAPVVPTIETDGQHVDDRLTSINLRSTEELKIPEMSEEDKYQWGVLVSLVGLLIASLIEMLQAAMVCSDQEDCEGSEAFAVALGSVSSFSCLSILIANRCVKRSRKSFVYNKRLDENLLPYVSIFLTLWWVVGVVMCTFDEPFEETGNGYFACWMALLLSLYFCQITISKFGAIIMKCKNDVGNPQQRAMVIIALLSFMEAYACVLQLDEFNSLDDAAESKKASPQEYWGLSCGLISGGLVIIILIVEPRVRLLNGQPGVLSYFLVPWWLFGAGVVTFDQPFTVTGNGYFCAWGAFCMSAYLGYLMKSEKTGSVLKRLSSSEPFNPTLR